MSSTEQSISAESRNLNWFTICIGLILLIRGLGYWLFSVLLYPHAGFDFHAIFRRWGDTQYYPLIRALSEFNFGEPNILEHLGEGRVAFPFLSVSPYAAAFRLAGPAGFAFMDTLLVIVQYFLFFAIFRGIRLSKTLSACLSVLIVSNALNYIFVIDDAVFARLSGNPILFMSAATATLVSFYFFWKSSAKWLGAALILSGAMLLLPSWDNANVLFQMRIPRPLVTDVFFMSGLISLISPNALGKFRNFASVIFGFCLSFTLQGNLHSAVILGVFGAIWIIKDFNASRSVNHFLRDAVTALTSFLVPSAGFIYQRATDLPGQAEQLGLVRLDRLKPLFLTSRIEIGQLLFCLTLACACKLMEQRQKAEKHTVSNFIATLTIAAYLALPISWVVIGKGSFLQQYRDRFQLYSTLTIVAGVAYLFQNSLSEITKRLRDNKSLKRALKVGFIGFCMGSTIAAGYRPAATMSHTRDGYEPLKFLGDSYKSDFLELTNVLNAKNKEDIKVLGTLDPQLFSWWRTFRGGYVYVSDNFSTTMPSEFLENRLLSFCKIIGMNLSQFEEFTNSFLGATMWSNVGALNTVPAILNQDFSAYSKKDQEVLKQLAPLDSWEFTYTVEKRDDINRHFAASNDVPIGRLDAIVLINDPLQAILAPPSSSYDVVLKNHSFRLFVKKQ